MKTRLIVRISAALFLSLFVFSFSPNARGAGPDDPDAPPLPPVQMTLIPEPDPVWTPPRHTTTENHLVSFDLASGVETILPLSEPGSLPEAAVSEGSAGLLADIANGAFAPENFTELSQVLGPENYPWRVNVKLYRHFPNWPAGTYSSCSGTLIDERHVITAGHCVYTWDASRCVAPATSCWADEIITIPAYENGNEPYGRAYGIQSYSYTGWTDSQDYNHDMGYFFLDRPVGELTGYHGYGYDNNDSFFETNTFHNPGYPAEDGYDGETMWYWYGTYDDVHTYILNFNRPGHGGQSGSGSYDIDGSNRYVYAVHSHTSGGTTAGQTRITSGKFSTIQNRIATNTPGSVDLIPLDVNVSPASIPEGTAISAMDYLVHNYSSATWNGSVTVNVYLSTNDNISTADTLIDTHSFNTTINPRSSVRVNVSSPPTIPYGSSGTRYIGVILDLADANTGNNDTDGWDADETTIIGCPEPGTATLYAPANGAYTNDNTPYFDWSSPSYASQYRLLVDNNGDWSSPEIDVWVSNSNYTPGSALPDGHYYWAVLSRNTTGGCNNNGSWSSVWGMWVDTVDPTNPTFLSSSSHAAFVWSNDSTVTMTWSGATDATSGVQGYGVYWSQFPTSMPSQTVDTTGTSYTSSPLGEGNNWYFHLITADNANNWTNSALHRGPYYIDLTNPTSSMTALANMQCATSIQLNWSGADNLSGVDDYYLQYRVGGGGVWTTWFAGTSLTSATFGPLSPVVVAHGQTYYFRVAAQDWAGNTEPYPGGDGDTWTMVAHCFYLPLSSK